MTPETKTLAVAATGTAAANVATWKLGELHEIASFLLAVVSIIWVLFQLTKSAWIWYVEVKTGSPRVTRKKKLT